MDLPGSEAVTLTSIAPMLGPHVSVASARTLHHIMSLRRNQRAFFFPPLFFFSFFFFNVSLFIWRERAHEQGGAERERDREFQVGSIPSVQSWMQGLSPKPQDHDLS